MMVLYVCWIAIVWFVHAAERRKRAEKAGKPES
jgi:cbb3-type cytochrome oxidase subunit 3